MRSQQRGEREAAGEDQDAGDEQACRAGVRGPPGDKRERQRCRVDAADSGELVCRERSIPQPGRGGGERQHAGERHDVESEDSSVLGVSDCGEDERENDEKQRRRLGDRDRKRAQQRGVLCDRRIGGRLAP